MKKIVFILLLFIAVKVEAKIDKGDAQKALFVQDTDTLNILFSAYGNVYYYTSPLAEDASNFKSASPKDIELVIRVAEQEAKQKDHSLVVLIKSESSKKAEDIARWYNKYTRSKLTETEKKLIKLTEGSPGSKKDQ